MPEKILTCSACGKTFKWTEKEQAEQLLDLRPGDHLPKDCPEGLDQHCPSCAVEVYDPPTECKSCRVKQDGQRS